ncbi:MAG: hypothetical protein PHT53_02385 [Candidatus Omnitrophica bacterium]|nr:hypothetical protein [Candidatus Omnitrophota bacterium]
MTQSLPDRVYYYNAGLTGVKDLSPSGIDTFLLLQATTWQKAKNKYFFINDT